MPKTIVRTHAKVDREDAALFDQNGDALTARINETILDGLCELGIPGTWDVELYLRRAKRRRQPPVPPSTERLSPHKPVHPGTIVLEEMKARRLSLSGLRKLMGLSQLDKRLEDIIDGRDRIEAHTAWRLAKVFGTSPEYWMNLQVAHDLDLNKDAAKFAEPHERKGR